MRQQFADTVYIHDGFAVAVVSRSLYVVQADFLTHLAGEFVVDGMSRAGSDDTSLDRLTYQSQVTDYVEQFVTGTFIGPYQRFVVDVTHLFGIHVRNSHYVGQLVEVFLGHFAFVDHNGIVQIAAFDEAGLQQWFNLAYEYECAAGSYFVFEFRHILQCCKLVGNDGRIVRYQYIQTEVLIGQHDDGRTGLFIAELNLRLDNIEIFNGVLFFCTYALYLFCIVLGATVQNRKLRTVDLYQAVVDA